MFSLMTPEAIFVWEHFLILGLNLVPVRENKQMF